MDDLFEAIDGIKDDLSTTLIVGYSDAYNKSLLIKMAERIGGGLDGLKTLYFNSEI